MSVCKTFKLKLVYTIRLPLQIGGLSLLMQITLDDNPITKTYKVIHSPILLATKKHKI